VARYPQLALFPTVLVDRNPQTIITRLKTRRVPQSNPESPEDKARKAAHGWMKYSGMAFQMIGIILAFVFAGVYLDRWLETGPIFTVVMSLLGVAGGLYTSLRDFL
jgi:F0F1-type ATP synthase assembly protein I